MMMALKSTNHNVSPGELGDEGGNHLADVRVQGRMAQVLERVSPRHDPKRFKDTTGKCLPAGIRIPRPDKWDHLLKTVPELISVQERLKAKGLRDPWIRHYIYQYDYDVYGHRRQQIGTFARVLKYGVVAAFIVTLAIEKASLPLKNRHDHHLGSQYKLLKDLEINRSPGETRIGTPINCILEKKIGLLTK